MNGVEKTAVIAAIQRLAEQNGGVPTHVRMEKWNDMALSSATTIAKHLGSKVQQVAANKDGPSEEGPSGQPSGDGGGVTPK